MDEYDRIIQSTAIYLDASCLVKIGKEEGDSSRTMRLLLYGCTIPACTSLIGVGEYVGVMGKRDVQAEMGIGRYLFNVRSLLGDLNLGKIKRAEPSEDRFLFLNDADRIHAKYPKIGGGDLWHLLSVCELRRKDPNVCLVTFDQGMKKAARAEGFEIVNGDALNPEELVSRLQDAGKYVALPPPPRPTGP